MRRSVDLLITNAQIVTEQGILHQGALRIAKGTIVWSGSQDDTGFESHLRQAGQILDAKGGLLMPGFIDVHVHGGFGSDFMEADLSAYDTITRFHGAHGTTAMLATTVTASKESIDKVLAASEAYRQSVMRGARLLGVHLEGPFISPRWAGAQNPDYIVPPNQVWAEEWISRFPGLVRILTLAPETDGAMELIEWASQNGVVCACGHTDADYNTLLQAADRGLRHAVHTFNAMKGLHHRSPGTAGAVLTDERISAEVIADGMHVHPACIQLLAKAKKADQMLLITDAISAAGLGSGSYRLGGLDIRVGSGAARLKDGGSLAGSTLTMIDAFRFAVFNAGLSIEHASRAASGNPARLLGIFDRTGSIAAGKQADLVLTSPNLHLLQVWAAGNPISDYV